MRLSKILTTSISVFLFTIFAQAQDSKPAILEEIGYTMPQAVIDAEIGGTVRLGVRVEETGKVSRVWILAGPMWPCGKTPVKAIEKLSDSLSDTLKAVRFTPAIKDGKAITENVGLSLKLENPKLEPAAIEADLITGKPNPRLVHQGVLNGKAISLPKPAYPAEARANRDGGTVTVQVLIDEEGSVIRAGALTGAPTLQYAARDSACGAKFSPTTLQGSPIKVAGVITYNFVPGPIR